MLYHLSYDPAGHAHPERKQGPESKRRVSDPSPRRPLRRSSLPSPARHAAILAELAASAIGEIHAVGLLIPVTTGGLLPHALLT